MAIDATTLRDIEARLFAANFCSIGDILRLKSLGVHWDGNVRTLPIEEKKSE